MADDPRIEEILCFWFGEPVGLEAVEQNGRKMWWAADAEIDAEIGQRFGDDVQRALAGELTHWGKTARGSLALVILLDQLTRNLGRGSGEAFAGDAAALAVCDDAMKRGLDRGLRPVERSFLYMPLMHAEDRETARRSLATFAALSNEGAGIDFSSHAEQHAEIVLRFGRYPHRNELLGRESTPEERDFLAAGGPSFGQKKT